jgi:hypothetical protein
MDDSRGRPKHPVDPKTRLGAAALGNGKRLLTAIGARLSPRRLHQLQMVLNYLKLGRWMREQGFHVARRLPDREAVFRSVAERVADRRVLYLEFGVLRGKSLRWWSQALRHPESRLHGFDSFEGLPEPFDVGGPYGRGACNAQGVIPDLDDPRVELYPGWFEDVLPSYTPPAHDVLVVTMDADLYSSTIFVLRWLRTHLEPGAYLYFDNLSRPEHEPRAFEEFIRESGLRFAPVAADRALNRVFFECLGPEPGEPAAPAERGARTPVPTSP